MDDNQPQIMVDNVSLWFTHCVDLQLSMNTSDMCSAADLPACLVFLSCSSLASIAHQNFHAGDSIRI